MKIKSIKKYTLILYCLLISLLLLGICSKSSPLYPMNDWVDVHCFFTMGKSMLHGQVLYADLYEQKGPVLYFIYALVALISDSSFIGVFLLEVVTFGFFLFLCGKLVKLYLGENIWIYLIPGIIGTAIVISPAFSHGGSVEQMCLGFMCYGLYSVLRALREDRPLTFREGVLNGVFAGMILWIKFTMLGFYVGLCLFVVIWYLVKIKDFRKLLQVMGSFLLGVAAVSSVVFIYFALNHALKDLYTAYFYNNLFLYPSESGGSKIGQIFRCLFYGLQYNYSFCWMIILAAIWLLIRFWKHPLESLCIVLCFVGLTSLTYWGGKGIMQGYKYYDLVLSLFCIFGLIGIGWFLSFLSRPEFIPKDNGYVTAAAVALASLLLVCFATSNCRNTYLLSYDKEDMPQYRFAQIIRQEESPTLLNYGFLDGGFYYAADVIPNCKYFCTFNVPAPGMWETQEKYIEEGLVDFVVTRHYPLTSYGVDSSLYELVDTANMYFEGIDFTYYLYRLK